jgi:hypothetical protein
MMDAAQIEDWQRTMQAAHDRLWSAWRLIQQGTTTLLLHASRPGDPSDYEALVRLLVEPEYATVAGVYGPTGRWLALETAGGFSSYQPPGPVRVPYDTRTEAVNAIRVRARLAPLAPGAADLAAAGT